MASITKQANGWYAQVRRKGYPAQSRLHSTRAEAQDWAAQVEADIARGTWRPTADAGYTVRQAWNAYTASSHHLEKTEKSRRGERNKSNALLERLGDYGTVVLEARPELIADYRDQRLAAGKAGDTVRLELALLSSIYKLAIEQRKATRNPITGLRKPKLHAREMRIPPSDRARILTALETAPAELEVWTLLCLTTGMRPGEAAEVLRHQVDTTKWRVTLERTKNGRARTVPVVDLQTQTAIKKLDGLPGPYLYGAKPFYYQKRWQALLQTAGLTHFPAHCMRHEYVSQLFESSLQLSDGQIAGLTGHTNPQSLWRYKHLRNAALTAQLAQHAAEQELVVLTEQMRQLAKT
jgi:integrase